VSHGEASRLRGKVGSRVRVRNRATFVGVEALLMKGKGGSAVYERHRDGDE